MTTNWTNCAKYYIYMFVYGVNVWFVRQYWEPNLSLMLTLYNFPLVEHKLIVITNYILILVLVCISWSTFCLGCPQSNSSYADYKTYHTTPEQTASTHLWISWIRRASSVTTTYTQLWADKSSTGRIVLRAARLPYLLKYFVFPIKQILITYYVYYT